MEQQDTFTNGGRAFPDAIDGTPKNYQEREALENPEMLNEDDHDIDDNALPTPVVGAELDRDIVEACQEVIEWKSERKEINANIQAVIERMESKGIPRAAFKVCLANMEMTEDQREAYDRGIMITRGAVGLPVQADMFERKLDA